MPKKPTPAEPTIKRGKITDYIPAEINPNKSNPRGVPSIVNSLHQFGAGRSIVVDRDGEAIGGSHTLQAALDAGIENVIEVESDGDAIIVHKRRDLDLTTDAKARGLQIADNRTSELGYTADDELLAEMLTQIGAEDARFVEAAGFEDYDVRELMESIGQGEPAPDPGAQVDKAAELQERWQVSRGDLWQIGKHRLLCGDSTSADDVAQLMGGEKANAVVTDPPYGVEYEGGRNPVSNTPRAKLEGDHSADLYRSFLKVWVKNVTPRATFYLWFAGRKGLQVYSAIDAVGLDVRALIIWNKVDPHYGNFMAQYMQKHEPCLYCVQDATDWYGATNEVTVWDIKQPTVNEHHPTEKPLECMQRPINNSTKHGDIVADPFGGSGTTMVACEQLSRQCRMIEISEKYCAVILQRMHDMGVKAERINGRP